MIYNRYSNWYPRQPDGDGGNGDCVHIWSSRFDRKWNDAPCSFTFSYICERSCKSYNIIYESHVDTHMYLGCDVN